MAKVKITPKMRSQTKLLTKETMRNSELNFKSLSKVFSEFGEETEKQLIRNFSKAVEKKITMEDLKWDLLKSKLETVMYTNSKRSTNNFTKFLNKLYKFNLSQDKIEGINNVAVDDYAKVLAQKVTYVTDTTKDRIAKLIDNNKGLNTNDLMKLIHENISDMSLKRAKTIARTETANLMNNANAMTSRTVGMKYKTFMHGVNSPNERPHHKELSGTKIPFDEQFDLNGSLCDFPHDNSLPASEVVNCSCLCIYSNR